MTAVRQGDKETHGKDGMTLNLPNIACLDQSDIIVGLVAFDYGRQILQACWEDGLIKCEGCLAPFTILCMSEARC